MERLSSSSDGDALTLARELAMLIREFHVRHKYLGIAIEGYQGLGKTTLALMIAKEYYGSWRAAFESVRFSLRDFIAESVEAVKLFRRIPLRILDDFSFQGGSKWKKEKELIDLLEYMNVIRTLYTSLIFTYVDNSGARFIRDNAKIKLVMNMRDLDTVDVRVYSRRYSVMGVYWKRIMNVVFRPQEVHSISEFRELYEQYWRNRVKAVEKKGKRLLEGLDSRKLRLFDLILGYYLGRSNLPLRDIPGIFRQITEFQFRNETFYKVKQIVLRKLKEYEIIGLDGSGEQ